MRQATLSFHKRPNDMVVYKQTDKLKPGIFNVDYKSLNPSPILQRKAYKDWTDLDQTNQ